MYLYYGEKEKCIGGVKQVVVKDGKMTITVNNGIYERPFNTENGYFSVEAAKNNKSCYCKGLHMAILNHDQICGLIPSDYHYMEDSLPHVEPPTKGFRYGVSIISVSTGTSVGEDGVKRGMITISTEDKVYTPGKLYPPESKEYELLRRHKSLIHRNISNGEYNYTCRTAYHDYSSTGTTLIYEFNDSAYKPEENYFVPEDFAKVSEVNFDTFNIGFVITESSLD